MADWCLHGSLWYYGVAVYLACAITAGALLPYHRCEMVYVLLYCCTDPGGPVFVLTYCVGVPRCVCCALAARVCILTY